jgi:transmembrane sensor
MADDRESDWNALARYLAGEGDPAERSRVERELAANPARASLVAALDDALRAAESTALTPLEVDAALQAVLARRDEGAKVVIPLRADRSRWRDIGLRTAAAILVVVGAALTWRAASHTSNESGSRGRQAAGRQLATGMGVIDSVVLPDRSLVILGPASALTVAADYGVSSRVLTLRGQALFDVRHDPSRPFIVRTAAAELRDVGTRFAVESQGAEELRVVVLGGAVAVRPARADHPSTDTLLARDRGVILADGVLRVERQAAAGEDVAWIGRQIIFRDAPVTQVAAELVRWYGLELRVADSALRTRRLTATFDHAPREEIARVLAATLGGTPRLAGDTLWILPARLSPSHR